MWVRGKKKTETVYTAVDQSLEKDKFRMMRNRDGGKKTVAHTLIFFHLELKTSVNPNPAQQGCLLLSDKCPLLAKIPHVIRATIFFF